MKDTIVFSKTVIVPHRQEKKIDGDVCIIGDLTGTNTSSLEVLGDLYVTGEISIGGINVHGNIHCGRLDVCTCYCKGDIHVESVAVATNVTCMGILSVDTICYIDNITVYESAFVGVYIGKSFRAIDGLNCKGTLAFSKSLVAGGDVNCAGEILPSSDDFEIFVKGNLMSKNIRISSIA